MKASILLCIICATVVFGRAFYPKDDNVTLPFNTCGGNCPSNDCGSCPCGTTPTECNKFASWDKKCCECIASHESGGNSHAANENTNGSFDVGLWQINSVNWASCSSSKAPCDVAPNLECAKKVWAWGGNSFKLWSTCGACKCC